MGTKRRSMQSQAAQAVCALLILSAIGVLAFTRSTAVAPRGLDRAKIVLAPETERATGAMTPDEYLDFKQSSNDVVTEAQVMRQKAQAAAVAPAAAGSAMPWQQLGPYNIGGRVTDVVADRTMPNGVFAAVSGGGIWHSSDGGTTWTPVWPNENVQSMGAFAQAKDGTLWA